MKLSQDYKHLLDKYKYDKDVFEHLYSQIIYNHVMKLDPEWLDELESYRKQLLNKDDT